MSDLQPIPPPTAPGRYMAAYRDRDGKVWVGMLPYDPSCGWGEWPFGCPGIEVLDWRPVNEQTPAAPQTWRDRPGML